MELNGKAALITGGASGMGFATAQAFAQAGVKVALLDVNAEAVARQAAAIGGLGIVCDVTDEASVQKAIAQASAQHGVARIVVNCAGVATAGRIVGKEGPLPLAAFRRVIDINLGGTFNVLRLGAAAMMAAEPVNEDGERGVIINTASVAAYEGQIGQAAYAASKGAIVGLTLPAAREFAKFGIRVLTIAPGLIETPLFAGLAPQAVEALKASTVYPKRLGFASEYAALARQCVENALLNGTVLRLDGAVRLA